MHRIEQQNHDNFTLNLDVKHGRRGLGPGLVYTLSVVEDADHHTLVTGSGPDLDHALDEIEGGLEDAMAAIGYHCVD